MISDFIYKVLVVVVAIIIANIIIKKFMPDKSTKKIVKPIHKFYRGDSLKHEC